MAGATRRTEDLSALVEPLRGELDAVNQAREAGLAASRRTIRACGRAIRAIHRHEPEVFEALVEEARVAIREAQEAVAPHPVIACAGFLHDGEKEYAEAILTASLVNGGTIPSAAEVGVQAPAWLNGLAEAASELRRYLLDRLRAGDHATAESLLLAMEDVYDVLVTFDYPDAICGGLRRTVDALRAVLERSRADVTTTVLQTRLQRAIEDAAKQ